MEPAKEEKRCPECENVLEEIKAIAFFSMLSGQQFPLMARSPQTSASRSEF
jgi:hypothetical protein